MFDIYGKWRLVTAVTVWLAVWPMGTAADGLRTGSMHRSLKADIPSSAYEHAQTLVALPDGRRLNIFCIGAGTPVVILEAGGGDDSLTFQRAQGCLSSVTRVCSYDRAGMGFSDASDGPSTAAHTVSDLHALVEKTALPKPFVLVGHSNGGIYTSLYAARFPDEVAGLVMIDPNNLGLDMAAEKVLDEPWLKRWRTSDQADIKQARLCLALAGKGALKRAPSRFSKCMDDPPNADIAIHRLLNIQLARPSEQEALLAELVDTYPEQDGGLSNAELTLQRANFTFGDKPLIVLSATNEQSALPPSERVKVNKAMLANQANLAARSTRGKQVFVNSSTEYIQTYQPEVVIRAVKDVVGEARLQALLRTIAPTTGKK